MFKVCARCGQEYQSCATECSDCGVPLDLAPGESLASEPDAQPTARALEDPVMLQLGEPRDLQTLAELLQAQGISCQIDVYPPGAGMSASRSGVRGQAARLGLYVSGDDLDAARAIARELAARELSDPIVATEHDPSACPACGEPTPENAASCSSCGLEFPEVPEAAN